MPVRVGQVIESVGLKAGGTSTAFLNILDAVRSRDGLSVHAFSTPAPSGDPAACDALEHPSEWTLATGTATGLRPGPLGRAVVAAVDAGRIDVLHLHGLWSADLLAGARACARRSVPVFWQPHGMLAQAAYSQKRWKKELFMAAGLRAALRGAAGLIFVTGEERDHSVVPAGIPGSRLAVVPLPVTIPPEPVSAEERRAFRARFQLPDDAPVIVFLGRLHPVKRVDLAIRALAAITTDAPNAVLLIAGGGGEQAERDLRLIAENLGVAARVRFAGWVEGREKWLALAAGDALTLNSLHENFGYVAVEALCVGTRPVLTDNLAIAPELSAAGLADLAASTPAELGAAWLRAVRTDRSATLRGGRAWVEQHLSHGAVGTCLERLYGAAIRERAPADVGA